MTDSYVITFDDGEQIYYNAQACFAPMKDLKGNIGFMKGKGQKWLDNRKAKSITYTVGIQDHALLYKYFKMLKDIKTFNDIILNIHCDMYSTTCAITLDLSKPSDAVLYTLGALRYIKERKVDQDIIKVLLDSGLYKYSGILYLLMEHLEMRRGDFSIIGDRGHANSDASITVDQALAFNAGTLDFGVCQPYNECLTYTRGWGQTISRAKNKSPNFVKTFVVAANRKAGTHHAKILTGIEAVMKVRSDKGVTTVSAPNAKRPDKQAVWAAQYGANPARRMAQMPQVRAEAAVQADVPKTIRVGKLDVQITEADWTRRLNPKRWLHPANRQRLYRQGYDIGFRLRK